MNLLNLLNKLGRIGTKKSSNRNPIILLGTPRSNSTLIHRLLSRHTQLVTPSLKELLFPGKLGGISRTFFSLVPQNIVDKLSNPLIHRTGPNFPEADDIALMAAFEEGVFSWVHVKALKGVKTPIFNENKHIPYLGELYEEIENRHSKRVVSKYFAGIFQFEKLKTTFPNGKFVLLVRDPKQICYSTSTMLYHSLSKRGIRLENNHPYWQLLYQYLIESYSKIVMLMTEKSDEILIINDADVKNNLYGVINKICLFAEISMENEHALTTEIEARSSHGHYQKKYEYVTVMDDIFNYHDFENYYDFLNKPSNQANTKTIV
jgi:Sulfotransferase family